MSKLIIGRPPKIKAVKPISAAEFIKAEFGSKLGPYQRWLFSLNKHDRLRLLLPRGFSKSLFTKWRVMNKFITATHDCKIGYYSYSAAQSAEHLVDAKDYINKFSDPVKDFKVSGEATLKIRNHNYAIVSAKAYSLNASIRGKHYGPGDMVIIDDPMHSNVVDPIIQPTLIEKVNSVFRRIVLPMIHDGVIVIICATPLTNDDFFLSDELIKTLGLHAERMPALNDKDKSVWPQMHPTKHLHNLRRTMTRAEFAAEYMLAPMQQSTPYFSVDQMRFLKKPVDVSDLEGREFVVGYDYGEKLHLGSSMVFEYLPESEDWLGIEKHYYDGVPAHMQIAHVNELRDKYNAKVRADYSGQVFNTAFANGELHGWEILDDDDERRYLMTAANKLRMMSNLNALIQQKKIKFVQDDLLLKGFNQFDARLRQSDSGMKVQGFKRRLHADNVFACALAVDRPPHEDAFIVGDEDINRNER